MEVVPEERVTDSRESQPVNAPRLMRVTLSGIVVSEREEQKAKAKSPMDVTLSGRRS